MNTGACQYQTRLKNTDNSFRELFQRHPTNPILTAKQWPYPANTVFNPGATMFNGKVLLLARVEDRRGHSHLTKALSDDGITNWQIDPVATLEADPANHPEEIWGIEDPRIVRLDELNKWAITYTAYSRSGPLVAMALTSSTNGTLQVGSGTAESFCFLRSNSRAAAIAFAVQEPMFP